MVRNVAEKKNSHSTTRSMRAFDSLISDLELKDLQLQNAKFAWSNLRNPPICCRLDIFLISNDWDQKFRGARQLAVARAASDHCPIVIDNGLITWGPTPF